MGHRDRHPDDHERPVNPPVPRDVIPWENTEDSSTQRGANTPDKPQEIVSPHSPQANNSDCPPTEKPADSSSLLTEWQKKWSQYFNDLQDANALDAAIAKLTAEVKLQPRESEEPRCETRAQQHAWRPYRPQHGRRKQRKQGGYDATEGSPIQKLYRRSRVRAIKAITEEDSPYCTVPLSDVHTHFSSIYKERELNDAAMPPEVPELHCKTQGDEDPFVENFTPGEVWARLYRCGNTSPGPDGIRYPQWK